MNAHSVDVIVCCIGLVFVLSGVLVRLGIEKKWFALRPIPTVVIPSFGFGLIPVGLAFFSLGLVLLGRTNGWIPKPETGLNWVCWGVMPLFGFGLLLVACQPRWILPRWYRWLKDNYGDIMPQLREDAQHTGQWEWARMVRTQAGLERWAEEVRQRVEAERRSKRPSYRNKAS